MSTELEQPLSALSVSNSTTSDDWDRSISLDRDNVHTPNSVRFPGEGEDESEMTPGRPKRSLSELLRLHAEKGACFSAEEANRIAEVLGNWINAGSSPYEGEDDFFRSQDDNDIPSSQRATSSSRPRGKSEAAPPKP